MWSANINECSSGENQYDQQHYQGYWNTTSIINGYALQDINGAYPFQQQQNNFIPQEDQRSFYLGSSEFAPNNGMQPDTNQPSITHQSHCNYQESYSSLEMLSDAVATLVFMPTKFERTSFQLAEKFNKTVSDIKTLTDLVHNLMEKCLSENNFRPIAGRFCHYLANSVLPTFDGNTFCSLLLEKFQEIHSNHVQMISSNPKKFRSLVTFSTDLYLQFSRKNISVSSEIEDAKLDSEKREMQHILARLLYQLYLSTLTFGKQDAMNLTTVIDMLKLSGKLLEDDESFSRENGTNTIQINTLMNEIEKISNNQTEACQHSVELREALAQLVQIRALDWQVEASDRPTFFDMPQPKVSTERPHAIKIVKPLDEPCKNQENNARNERNHSTTSNDKLLPEEHELTEAELRFMSEEIDGTELIEQMCMMNTDESDNGSVEGRMPAEIEAAFEEFLIEQQAGLPVYQS